MLLAVHHARNGSVVCIMVTNRVLQKQFDMLINQYCSEQIHVRTTAGLKATHQYDVFICDESDLMIDEQAVLFRQEKGKLTYALYGMAAIWFSKKAYFMSATFDQYQEMSLKKAFGITNDILKFPNMLTFLTGVKSTDFNLEDKVCDAYDDVMDLLLE